jgi:alpha-glucosidase (family GH31 glycosyl hydrolase)
MRARCFSAVLLLGSLVPACSDPIKNTPPIDPCLRTEEAVAEPKLHTPRWAFEPWISKDISDGADTYAFVKGFRDRDIPVGAVVLDSPWETHYNTFIPHPTRYPNFDKMVQDLHADNIRVVLWMTNLVNSVSYDLETGGDSYVGASPNLEEGDKCNYFVEDGARFSWWKGSGAAIDFFNPSATAWWHAQQNTVLDAGIDGWKLDFGDSYVRAEMVQTKTGAVPHQEYSEAYYQDFLAYGIKQRGPEFLTMVRAWDESYDFAGRFFARKEHTPVAWMGDNRRDWVGLSDALDHVFRSAAAGYAVVGSDIGGYLDRDDKDLLGPEIPLDPINFARWTAVGALTPFMQLHGRANITPWTVPQTNDEIVNVYRYWSKLHHELVPFWYSLAEEAYAGGSGIVRPIGDLSTWAGDYRYTLGEALFVAPILDGTGKREVVLPAGAKYYDYWAPAADPIDGGMTVMTDHSADLKRIPLYFRSGAIIPMHVTDDITGFGTAASAGKLTLIVFPATTATSFTLHDTDDAPTQIQASAQAKSGSVTISRTLVETLVRLRADAKPSSVMVNGAAAMEHADRAGFDASSFGYYHDVSMRSIWVKVAANAKESSVQIQLP